MEKHVTSLEWSRKLKEAGWKKGTEFWWIITSTTNWHVSYGKPDKTWQKMNQGNFYPAPLATELLEELPNSLYTLDSRYHFYLSWESVNDKKQYNCELTPHEPVCERTLSLAKTVYGETLPNALAAMWCYLNKN